MPSWVVPIDVRDVAPTGVTTCTVEVFPPTRADRAPFVAFCLPGGYYNRRYFDLDVPPDVGEYSMARHLATAGLVVVTCDPPGIGDSDTPDDPFALSPAVLADVHAHVVRTVLEGLRAGSLVDGFAPVANVAPIGIGHSAGALLTVHTQARHRPFVALALLGFAGRGLVEFLTDDERAYANDPEAVRRALPELVRARFGDPLPPFPGSATSIFSGGSAPPAARDAMRAAQDRLLTLLGLASMIPGASAPELAAVDVPVFLGVGDGDIAGPPRRIPADFPNARDITLFVLAGSGHAHNLAARRTELWDRMVRWVDGLARPSEVD